MSSSLSTELKNDVLIAVVVGNIDGQSAPGLQAQLLDGLTPAVNVVLDVSGVAYMSSAGFRLLLLVYRSLAIKGGRLAIVGLSEEIRDTMEMTGFLDFFVLAPSLDEACTSISPTRSACKGAAC